MREGIDLREAIDLREGSGHDGPEGTEPKRPGRRRVDHAVFGDSSYYLG